jgi:hypothetical protein
MKALFASLLILLTVQAKSQKYTAENAGGTRKVVYNRTSLSSFSVETRGKMEVTDDDRDIKSMSPDGYLEITKTVFGSKRKIVISPVSSGLKKEYYEGRTPVAWEPEGRKWLSEILPEIVRSTTIAAESRVNRFYRNGGVNAVLDEIRAIESDFVRAHYANLLVNVNQPSQNLPIIIAEVSDIMDSDHYLAEFLTKNLKVFMPTKEAVKAVFVATGKMDSDHYRTEVIKETLYLGPTSQENVAAAMEATNKMESDHYKTEVLTSLLRQNNLTDAMIAEMISTTKGMESDHYRTVVLTKALSKPGLTSTSFQRVLESVKMMDSDHYKTEVLTSLLGNTISADVQSQLIAATSSIESDHYVTVVGKQILRKVPLTDEAFKNLLDEMATHQSDYYRAEFLKSASERPNISKNNLLNILNAAGSIDSDHYITDVLVTLAPTLKSMNDQSLKDAYRSAAKKIESETYYGRALRAID